MLRPGYCYGKRPALLAELERVLRRTKFRPYVTTPEIRAYIALLSRLSSVKPDAEVADGRAEERNYHPVTVWQCFIASAP